MGERERKSDTKSVRVLNGIISWTPDGIEWEADQRHAEIIIRQMGLKSGPKGVVTPGVRVPLDESKQDER